MYNLKGFMNVGTFADNTVGNVISPIGEISSYSLSFSREVGQYSPTAQPDLTLLTFLSASEETGKQTVPAAVLDQTMRVGQWLYNRTIGGNQSTDRDQILTDILAAFQSEASDFDCGNIVGDSAGRYFMPEWIVWVNRNYQSGDNRIKIWFSDASFRAQYDETEILILPPFVPVDDFFKTAASVKLRLAERSRQDTTNQLQTLKGNIPESILRTEVYNYINPLDKNDKTPAEFNLLIYGPAGNNIDTIKDALANYLLSHSTHTREEWVEILPDIFKRTEFIMVPRWDLVAMPDSNMKTGIYSPVGNLADMLIQIKKYAQTGYTAAHVEANAANFGHPFKSLVIGIVGGPENRDNKFSLLDFYPDYISVATTSTDFGRMSQATMAWCYKMAEMLLVAETMTKYSDVPQGMTRLFRGEIMYLVGSLDNVQYLIVPKWNFEQAVQP